ncbi:hypothetical protein ANRL3_01667 [Anaerolineae bacterium]|nr:hypothetical protein ANRL3_01667 [Anaerolineae bacterium]
MVGIVIWLSLTPLPPQPPGFLNWDKGQHVAAYACLMYWYGMGFGRHWRWPVFLVGLGVGLEFLQGYGGFRSFDPFDMIANTIGVGFGLIVLKTPAGQCLGVVDKQLASRLGCSV